MPSGPFDADLDLEARHALGERLRLLLEADALDVRAMAAGLGVEPEVVVVALRELRLSGVGRLRTAVALGRVTWRWEPLGAEAPAVATVAVAGGSASGPGGPGGGRKKGKRKRG
ncbi:MAG TPA: hypothetical protein VNK05_18260 [Chloroflexota bacterium]|nr:hypothetical protein [Chloroflexota bacterium]